MVKCTITTDVEMIRNSRRVDTCIYIYIHIYIYIYLHIYTQTHGQRLLTPWDVKRCHKKVCIRGTNDWPLQYGGFSEIEQGIRSMSDSSSAFSYEVSNVAVKCPSWVPNNLTKKRKVRKPRNEDRHLVSRAPNFASYPHHLCSKSSLAQLFIMGIRSAILQHKPIPSIVVSVFCDIPLHIFIPSSWLINIHMICILHWLVDSIPVQ